MTSSALKLLSFQQLSSGVSCLLFTVGSPLRDIKRQSLREIADIQNPDPLLAALVQAGLVKQTHEAEIRALLDKSRRREAMTCLCCHLLLMNDSETQVFFECLAKLHPKLKFLLEKRRSAAERGTHSGKYSEYFFLCVHTCACARVYWRDS